LKKGVQTAICCPCGNEKILALGLCGTCYTLKRQDAEYFGGLREQVLERDGTPAGCAVILIPECIIGNRASLFCI
jgi:hypothetical protein